MASKIDYTERKYKKVSANSVETSGGTVIPNGVTVALTEFILQGSDPDAYCLIVFDYGGDEIVLASTNGSIHSRVDSSNAGYQVTGDGVKSLKIVIINNGSTTSPYVGGMYELTRV